MNLVERFFGDLNEFISERSFASTRELADAIIAFLVARNDNPRRYAWKAEGEEILRKMSAAGQVLAARQSQSNVISEAARQQRNRVRSPDRHARGREPKLLEVCGCSGRPPLRSRRIRQ
jgi:hypothetical protein